MIYFQQMHLKKFIRWRNINQNFWSCSFTVIIYTCLTIYRQGLSQDPSYLFLDRLFPENLYGQANVFMKNSQVWLLGVITKLYPNKSLSKAYLKCKLPFLTHEANFNVVGIGIWSSWVAKFVEAEILWLQFQTGILKFWLRPWLYGAKRSISSEFP